MGQLDIFSLDEMYFSGALTGLMGIYFAESTESDIVESFKAYFYSAVIYSADTGSKCKKLIKFPIIVRVVGSKAWFKSWSIFDFLFVNSVTKTIEDIVAWWDWSLFDFSVDLRLLKLQDRYNW